jgi:hypothetical protein
MVAYPMKRVWQIFLMASTAVVLFFAVVIVSAVIGHWLDTERATLPAYTPEQAVEQAFETCRYGAQQFYYGRGISIPESQELAYADCLVSYEFYEYNDDEFVAAFHPRYSYQQIVEAAR